MVYLKMRLFLVLLLNFGLPERLIVSGEWFIWLGGEIGAIGSEMAAILMPQDIDGRILWSF